MIRKGGGINMARRVVKVVGWRATYTNVAKRGFRLDI